MDLFAAFGVFLACVACCMVMGLPQFLALLVGLVCFFLVGLHRGHRAADLVQMTLTGMKTSVKVLRILVLIGLLTALWRAGGRWPSSSGEAHNSSHPGPSSWWPFCCQPCSAWPLAVPSV